MIWVSWIIFIRWWVVKGLVKIKESDLGVIVVLKDSGF